MRLLELIAYHGNDQDNPEFAHSRMGTISTNFSTGKILRFGSFFTNNPDFAAIYGNVQEYDLNVHNIATDLRNLAYDFSLELDAHDPDQRTTWIYATGIARSTADDLWELFDGDLGEVFVPWLIDQGHDSAQFEEWDTNNDGEEIKSLTTVVFDPRNIKQIDINEWIENYDSGDPMVTTDDGNDPEYVYRIMSKNEYETAKNSGEFIAGKNGRIHASEKPDEKYRNKPDDVIVKLEYNRGDGWRAKVG